MLLPKPIGAPINEMWLNLKPKCLALRIFVFECRCSNKTICIQIEGIWRFQLLQNHQFLDTDVLWQNITETTLIIYACWFILYEFLVKLKIQGIRSWSETGESRHIQLIAISLFISFEYQFLTQVDMELGSSFSVIRIV